MNPSRRDILKLGAGTAALWALGTGCTAPAPHGSEPMSPAKRSIPIGLQLWSVRDDCAKDFPGTLAAVAKMGYQGVEFAGYHGRKAEDLRKLLADLGLKACGSHTGLDTLTGDAFQQTAEFNQAIGNRYLIVPGLPGTIMTSVEALQDTARLLTEASEKAEALGMYVGYHCHAPDFQPLNGQTPWDIIFSNAGPRVVMQLDTGNCLKGGGDPVAMLKKYPGRARTVHLKEEGRSQYVIGEGDVKWAEVLKLCQTTGGTEWYIVEQEQYAAPPLDCVRQCLVNLRKLTA